MKAFSTTSARMEVIRKEGFYMSRRTAGMVAGKLAAVFQLHERQVALLKLFLEGYNVSRDLSFCSSGNEMETFLRLSEWYSKDEDSPQAQQRAYVAVDLNTGRALVIVSKQDMRASEVFADNTARQAKRERGLSENRLDGSNPKG